MSEEEKFNSLLEKVLNDSVAFLQEEYKLYGKFLLAPSCVFKTGLTRKQRIKAKLEEVLVRFGSDEEETEITRDLMALLTLLKMVELDQDLEEPDNIKKETPRLGFSG